MSKNARITCKHCKKSFRRIDWMENKICENPNCNCPEVKKAMREAYQAIEKAQTTSKIEKYEKDIPDGYDFSLQDNQLYLDCPPVQVINITYQKKG